MYMSVASPLPAEPHGFSRFGKLSRPLRRRSASKMPASTGLHQKIEARFAAAMAASKSQRKWDKGFAAHLGLAPTREITARTLPAVSQRFSRLRKLSRALVVDLPSKLPAFAGVYERFGARARQRSHRTQDRDLRRRLSGSARSCRIRGRKSTVRHSRHLGNSSDFDFSGVVVNRTDRS